MVWLSWLECGPINRKVMSSIPGQGTYLGCGFDPPSKHMLGLQLWCPVGVRVRGNQLTFLFHIYVSVHLFLSLHSSLSRINKHVLRWGFKKKASCINTGSIVSRTRYIWGVCVCVYVCITVLLSILHVWDHFLNDVLNSYSTLEKTYWLTNVSLEQRTVTILWKDSKLSFEKWLVSWT